MNLSNVMKNKVYNVFRGTALTLSKVYVALHTSAPSDSGSGGTEIAGNGYGRVALTLSAPTNGVGANSVAARYGVPSGDWGTVTHFSIWSHKSSGEFLAWNALQASREVYQNDIVRFNVGALDLEVS